MEINIDEIVSNVRAVDDRALLSPETVRGIVRAVMEAMEERERHRLRVAAEMRIGSGVASELREP